MLGMDKLDALLLAVERMRQDLNDKLGALIIEVRKINENLTEIEQQNKERFAQRHGTTPHSPRRQR